MAVPVVQLQALARARLKDAIALRSKKRFDAGFYLCGYAVELALKVRICKTLRWAGYPESAADLKIFKQFHTHDLNLLLLLTGRERVTIATAVARGQRRCL